MSKKKSLSLQIRKEIIEAWIHRKGNEVEAAVYDVLENNFKGDLKPIIAKKIKFDNGGYRFIIHLPPSVRYKDFYEKLDYFRDFTGGEVEINSGNRQKEGYYTKIGKIKIPRSVKGIGKVAILDVYPDPIKSEYAYQWDWSKYNKMYLPCPIGYQGGNRQFVIDLSQRHLLIGGNTRNGKSNLLHVILVSLLLSRNVMPVVIDMKRKVEFSYLHDLKQAIVVSEYNEVEKILDALNEKMNKRYDEITTHRPRVSKVQDLKNPPPFILLVIDEMKELDNYLMDKVNRLLYMGLAAGIICIGAIQRASHKVTKDFTETRALFEWNLCFKCRDADTSKMLLQNDRAMYIDNKPGRCIFQVENKEVELQVMKLPVSKAEEILTEVDPINIREEVDLLAQSHKMLPPK